MEKCKLPIRSKHRFFFSASVANDLVTHGASLCPAKQVAGCDEAVAAGKYSTGLRKHSCWGCNSWPLSGIRANHKHT
jgi:hypothetical protein